MLKKLLSFFSSPALDTSRSVFVEVKASFVNHDGVPYIQQVSNKSLLRFAKSKKMDHNYIFDINDTDDIWKFSLKHVSIEQHCITYELTYVTKGKGTVSLRELRDYISDGFHKTTNAGDMIPLQTERDGIFVKLYASDVKVFQKATTS
jgi:hypothetical protein